MKYKMERITNIKELKKIIQNSMITIQLLQQEIEKENSSNKNIDELSERLKNEYTQIKNFEFQIDVSEVNYCEKPKVDIPNVNVKFGDVQVIEDFISDKELDTKHIDCKSKTYTVLRLQ